jgi:hypothetical protein
MKRRLLNLLTALSLLLCAAASGLWLRSHFYMDSWAVQDRAKGMSWGASLGRIMVERTYAVAPNWYTPIDGVSKRRRSLPVDLSALRPVGLSTDVGALGFRYRSIVKPDESRHLLLVPFWAPVAVLAILPARCALSWVRQWRAVRPGLCPRCGYDLRATPDRCPECGHETRRSRKLNPYPPT